MVVAAAEGREARRKEQVSQPFLQDITKKNKKKDSYLIAKRVWQKMKVLLTVVAALAVVAAVEAGSGGLGKGEVFTWGHAAYTYGPLHCTQYDCDVVPSCNRVKWSTDIGDYNKNANPGSQINVVYSYGGDIEFWAGKSKPDGCHKLRIHRS